MNGLEGQKVRITRQVDGSNGPIPSGTIGVLLNRCNAAVAAEAAAAAGDGDRIAKARYMLSPAMRGHPSRQCSVATENGWCQVDVADLEAVAEDGAVAASETPGAPFDP